MSGVFGLNISVALCTYNGEKFLAEQLKSIARQSRAPNELVVCDDGSSDLTLEILENFAEASRFPVRIFCNEKNLGSTKNFEKAISLCNGGIIALSDQDDVWLPEKLELIETEFLNNPHVHAVFTDARVVDASLQPLGFSLWKSINFDPPLQKAFSQGQGLSILTKGNVVTGATMAFRSVYRDLILPIPKIWVHDAWIAILLAAVAEISFIPGKLTLYRQHADNQIGAAEGKRGVLSEVSTAKEWGPDEIFSKAKRLTLALNRLSESPHSSAARLELPREAIRHLLVIPYKNHRSIHCFPYSGPTNCG